MDRQSSPKGRITPLREMGRDTGTFRPDKRAVRNASGQRAAQQDSRSRKTSQEKPGRKVDGAAKTAPRARDSRNENAGRKKKNAAGRPSSRPKNKKHLPKKMRVGVTVFGFFCALLITAMIGIFLVFKVDKIEITGDQLYSKEDVMKACGYEYGDNLFFLSTTDKEQQLPVKLPYIRAAKIRRTIPGTIVIALTAAVPASQFQSGEQFVLLDDTGKVMDKITEIKEGVMQVTGAELGEQSYGRPVVMTEADKRSAYQSILSAIEAESALGEITQLDLTDVHNLSMVYQNRITMKLGGVADLDYKIQFGLNVIRERMAATARGTLGLALSPETGKTSFAEDRSKANESTGSEKNADGQTPKEKTYEFAKNPGRGSDIPDTPYTGASASESGNSDDGIGETGNAENKTEDA